MKPVNILGAGLSGLSAAINLAKEGFQVNIFDVRKDSGARFEGDLQGLENWTTENDILDDMKEMNIKVNFHCNPFKRVITTDGKKTFETDYPRPLFYLVKRGTMEDSIDQGLKRQALEAGVKINYNSRFEGKADVVAIGPKMESKVLYGIDKGIVFDTDIDDIAVAIFGDEFAYKGYSYLLVSKGYGCIATVLLDRFHLVNSCLEKTKGLMIKMFGLEVENEKGVGGFGNFIYPPRLEEDGTLFVGEAGGLQDGFAGFGIRYATTSGYLAAKSFVNKVSYKDSIDKRFTNQLKASVVNRFMWETVGGRKIDFLEFGSKRTNPLKYLGKLYNFELLYQKMIYPLASAWLKGRQKQKIPK